MAHCLYSRPPPAAHVTPLQLSHFLKSNANVCFPQLSSPHREDNTVLPLQVSSPTIVSPPGACCGKGAMIEGRDLPKGPEHACSRAKPFARNAVLGIMVRRDCRWNSSQMLF